MTPLRMPLLRVFVAGSVAWIVGYAPDSAWRAARRDEAHGAPSARWDGAGHVCPLHLARAVGIYLALAGLLGMMVVDAFGADK